MKVPHHGMEEFYPLGVASGSITLLKCILHWSRQYWQFIVCMRSEEHEIWAQHDPCLHYNKWMEKENGLAIIVHGLMSTWLWIGGSSKGGQEIRETWCQVSKFECNDSGTQWRSMLDARWWEMEGNCPPHSASVVFRSGDLIQCSVLIHRGL